MKFLPLLLLALITSAALAANAVEQVKIRGMVCKSCAKTIESELHKLPGVTDVKADFKKGAAVVSFKEGTHPDPSLIRQSVEKVGYHVTAITPQ